MPIKYNEISAISLPQIPKYYIPKSDLLCPVCPGSQVTLSGHIGEIKDNLFV
jgi:hypothetical protein